jgi:hypothetical protein
MGNKVYNILPNHRVCQKIRKETVFYKDVNILSITANNLLSETVNVLQIT